MVALTHSFTTVSLPGVPGAAGIPKAGQGAVLCAGVQLSIQLTNRQAQDQHVCLSVCVCVAGEGVDQQVDMQNQAPGRTAMLHHNLKVCAETSQGTTEALNVLVRTSTPPYSHTSALGCSGLGA